MIDLRDASVDHHLESRESAIEPSRNGTTNSLIEVCLVPFQRGRERHGLAQRSGPTGRFREFFGGFLLCVASLLIALASVAKLGFQLFEFSGVANRFLKNFIEFVIPLETAAQVGQRPRRSNNSFKGLICFATWVGSKSSRLWNRRSTFSCPALDPR